MCFTIYSWTSPRKSKVSNLCLKCIGKEDVYRFHISMYNCHICRKQVNPDMPLYIRDENTLVASLFKYCTELTTMEFYPKQVAFDK